MFSLRHPSTRTRRRPTLVAILAVVMAAGSLPLLIAPAANAANASVAGFVDFNFAAGAAGPDEPTNYHSQSKLWFHAGTWWAVMFDDNNLSPGLEIFSLNTQSQTWTTTGVAVDPRDKSHIDALADGDKLYIVSSNDSAGLTTAGTPNDQIRAYTYTYEAASKTYRLLPGMDRPGPDGALISAALGVRFATITKAGSTLWIGYTSNNAVWVLSSTDDGLSWTAPAALAIDPAHAPIVGADGNTKEADDVSVITTLNSGVGIMWSRTSTATSPYGGFFFATNTGSGWAEGPAAWDGQNIGDNHLSVKKATDGRIIAAVKSSLNQGGALNDPLPLIAVLQRSAAGSWSSPINVSSVVQAGTRPMLVLDEAAGAPQANVFLTVPHDLAQPTLGGDIFRRTAPLSTLDFGLVPSLGVPAIQDSQRVNVNDATSTKLPVDTSANASGLVVLASDKIDKNYLHACIGVSCTSDPSAPPPPATTRTTLAATPNPSVGGTNVTISATVVTDPPTGATPTGSITFRDNGAVIGPAVVLSNGSASLPTTSLSVGGHDLTAAYAPADTTAFQGGDSNTVAQNVTAVAVGARAPAPPVASFTADSTSGRTPLTVQFADTSSPAATSWAWNFGDGATDTTKTPAHTYTRSGTYTVKLTATNADGAGTATATITVIPGGARFTPVNPTRVLAGKAVGAKKFTTLTLRPPNGASAVALNVTVTRATKSSSVAVCNGDLVGADCTSQTVLRVRKGTQAAGFTMTRLGAADRVKIYNAAGTATVNAYVEGWFVGKPTETYFVAQGNRRALTAKALGQNKSFTFKIPAGLRPAGTTAVALNVSASGASAATSVSVCPASTRKALCKTRPSLYAARGAAVANHVVTRMGPGGTVKLVNRSGSVRLTVNVQGVYTTAKTGATFRPNPVRRVVTGRGLTAKGTFTMAMRSLPPGTTSVALRVTLTSPTANGSVSVCRGGTTTTACKATSAVPVQRGRTATTVVVVRVGAGGTVKFYNAAGKNKLFVDVFGSYGRT